jgi:hypothetical protein
MLAAAAPTDSFLVVTGAVAAAVVALVLLARRGVPRGGPSGRARAG